MERGEREMERQTQKKEEKLRIIGRICRNSRRWDNIDKVKRKNEG